MAETWIIRVVNDTVGEPTDLTVVEKATGDELGLNLKENAKSRSQSDKQNTKLKAGVLLGVREGLKATNSYLNFTGRKSRANALSATTKYASIGIGAVAIGATGLGAVGLGLTFAKDVISYEASNLDENAQARYLRESTNTRHNNGKGDFYKLRL